MLYLDWTDVQTCLPRPNSNSTLFKVLCLVTSNIFSKDLWTIFLVMCMGGWYYVFSPLALCKADTNLFVCTNYINNPYKMNPMKRLGKVAKMFM